MESRLTILFMILSVAVMGGRTALNPEDDDQLLEPEEEPYETQAPPVYMEGSGCSVQGDPHYRTFDGAWIPFQGKNKYTIARPKEGHGMTRFKILTKNEALSGSNFTVIRYVEIQLFGHIVRLGRGRVVSVDGKVRIPDMTFEGFRIFRNGLTIRLQTNKTEAGFRLVVEYDEANGLAIGLSEKYAGKMEGIMGNYDGNPHNDFITSNGVDVSHHPDKFNLIGNSWEVDDPESTRAPQPGKHIDVTCNNDTLAADAKYCGLILDMAGPFGKCLMDPKEKVDTLSYYRTCEFDVCAYEEDLGEAKKLACGHLMSMAADCKDNGFPVAKWRDVADCPYSCPPGMQYVEKTIACPANCGNPRADKECHLPDTESCACPAGTVMKQNECVETCGALKQLACISVAVDVSESIESTASKHQEAEVLGQLWNDMVSEGLLDFYHLKVTLFPFNEGVLEADAEVLTSKTYMTDQAFIEREEQIWRAIQEDIRKKNTTGLTDFAATFSYAAGIACETKVNGLIIISDFISTRNSDKFDEGLKKLKQAGVKVVAVALDKEREEKYFNKVKAVSDLAVDLQTEDLQDGPLFQVLYRVF